MAGATSTVAKPKRGEPGILVTNLHGVLLLCLFALLILTSEAADNVGRTPQLKNEYYFPYLREVAITLPLFVFPRCFIDISRAKS